VTPPLPGAEGAAPEIPAAPPTSRPAWRSFLKLARPKQWAKTVFVLIGPIYGAADGWPVRWSAVVFAVLAFSMASSACYVINDIRDREADCQHPRKRRRPIASGAVAVPAAGVFAGVLIAGAALLVLFVGAPARWWLAAALGAYVLNVSLYTTLFKNIVIIDVISLASGFVIRVLGGCAAADVPASSWLLNCTFFLAMFLAFGKRLGERRTLKDSAAAARGVQSTYTDELLRMVVVVTAVATLITYAGYVQVRGDAYTRGFNLLWLTVLPATYAMFRCMVLLESGDYDDPTELATADRPFQLASVVFAMITVAVMLMLRHVG
jgi:4-hydroxybenzoate polyprenyltransferase